MTTTINASPTNGLVATGDGSGVLKVQSNGVTTNALVWVNFNGITTTSIRSSYNVSSVTRNGSGDYTVNFTAALSDANYAAVPVGFSGAGTLSTSGGIAMEIGSNNTTFYRTTSAYRFITMQSGFASNDTYSASLVIFGN